MFDDKLLTETMNTLHSILVLLFKERELNIERIGSAPLEHTFGKARMKARYKQTLDNITKSIAIDQLLNDLKILNNLKISKRITSKRIASFDPNNYQQYFSDKSKDIAYALARCFGLISDDNSFISRYNLFYTELFNIPELINAKPKKKITLNNITLGVQNSLQCKSLIEIKPELKNAISNNNGIKEKLNSLFGRRLLKNDLILLANITSNDLKIEITKENKSTKKNLLDWFQENWGDLFNFLTEISIVNRF